MAVEYINWFMEIMSKNFPDFSQFDNNVLAWGGLHGIVGWVNKSSAEKTIILHADDSYKRNEKGTTPCQ